MGFSAHFPWGFSVGRPDGQGQRRPIAWTTLCQARSEGAAVGWLRMAEATSSLTGE